MPVSRLLVEGKLDREILSALFAGNPVIDPWPTSKGSLAPRCRDLRRDTGQTACYIRDRDFDFLPPHDLSQPTMDTKANGAALGWRWCRHEMENYLIDPSIVHAALGWDRAAFEAQLITAAQSIKHYQAARWTMGQSRRILPPAKQYPSKPPECVAHEFRLPGDLTQAAMATWIQNQTAGFLADVHAVLDAPPIMAELNNHSTRLTDTFLGNVVNVLVWCSGKDLLTAMQPWLQANAGIHPTQFRIQVRDWITANPDQTLATLPEWDAFRNILRAYP